MSTTFSAAFPGRVLANDPNGNLGHPSNYRFTFIIWSAHGKAIFAGSVSFVATPVLSKRPQNIDAADQASYQAKKIWPIAEAVG
jgi:hypothetical protein